MQNTFSPEAELFNALAHPARLEILEILRQGECCVCHIQAMLDQRQAYTSQHLNVLRQAGLVTKRKDGLRVYYKVSDPAIFELLEGSFTILSNLRRESRPTPTSSPRKPCTCPQCTGVPAPC